MSDKLWSIGLELLVLSVLAAIYYFWQRQRILYGPRNWQATKLSDVFQMALESQAPENFKDLEDFLSETENKLKSDTPWMNGEYIRRWANADLPANIKELLDECSQWHAQSQPKTR